MPASNNQWIHTMGNLQEAGHTSAGAWLTGNVGDPAAVTQVAEGRTVTCDREGP